ncbi:T9SS type A sorting domain-containing protein [bacterium]|nr:T9SS type A sorting domain-containing protein [bacterium]
MSFSFAQPSPDTLWTRTFGGEEYDLVFDIKQTSDGGYIIAGETASSEVMGAYLLRLDNDGDSLWMRIYRDEEDIHYFFNAFEVLQTEDGGYILTGGCQTTASAYIPYLLKTDGRGDVLWVKSYDDIYCDPLEGKALYQTSDGGYIIAADGGSGYLPDIVLIRTDSFGDTLWTRAYGLGSLDLVNRVFQTEDGGFILGGSTTPSLEQNLDFYLVKTDENGDVIWERSYGGTGDEWGWGLDKTQDGGYVIAGWLLGVDIDATWVIKTDSRGDTMWTRTYGREISEGASYIQQMDDGGYIIFGTIDFYGEPWSDYYLIRTDSLGDTLWTRAYGGLSSDLGQICQPTSDGGFVLAGWTLSYGAGSWDIWIVKTGPDIASASIPKPLPTEFSLHQNYPNPFNASTRIMFDLPKTEQVKLRVFDLLGREVATLLNGVREAGYHSVLFDGSNLPSGIYFCRLEAGGMHEAKKMVMLK